jgi:hypothetical protein
MNHQSTSFHERHPDTAEKEVMAMIEKDLHLESRPETGHHPPHHDTNNFQPLVRPLLLVTSRNRYR